MKKIENEVVVKTIETVYEAIDGNRFDSEEACKEWEKSYKCTVKVSWDKIPKQKINSCDFGLAYADCDYNCFMVIPRNMNDIVAINAFIKMKVNTEDSFLSAENIGKAMVLNFGFDYDWCDVYEMENRLAFLNRMWKETAEKLNNV